MFHAIDSSVISQTQSTVYNPIDSLDATLPPNGVLEAITLNTAAFELALAETYAEETAALLADLQAVWRADWSQGIEDEGLCRLIRQTVANLARENDTVRRLARKVKRLA